ncbi:hypothetical protein J6590_092596, partial [Homalodisca vitripennis]
MVVALEEQADTSKAWVPDATARCSSSRSKFADPDWHHYCAALRAVTAQSAHSRHYPRSWGFVDSRATSSRTLSSVYPSPTIGLSNGITNVWSAPTLFPSTTLPAKDATVMSNPFKGEGSWNNGDVGANPFRHSRPISTAVWSGVTNGQMSNGFTTSQSLNFSAPKVPWNNESINNPFM